MFDIAGAVKALTKEMGATLRPAGFVKQGPYFRRLVDGAVFGCLDLKKSRWNTKEEVAFSVGVGLRAFRPAALLEERIPADSHGMELIQFSGLGRRSPDKQWKLTSESTDADLEAIREDLLGVLHTTTAWIDAHWSDAFAAEKMLLDDEEAEFLAAVPRPPQGRATARLQLGLWSGERDIARRAVPDIHAGSAKGTVLLAAARDAGLL